MSQRTPWWYSGDDQEPADPSVASDDDTAPEDSGGSARDWMTLVAGAQRVVDWATERVMAPHAEHDDPRDHPDCVVCRTMTMLGDVGLRTSPASDVNTDTDTRVGPEAAVDGPLAGPAGPHPLVIEWIPIRGEGQEP